MKTLRFFIQLVVILTLASSAHAVEVIDRLGRKVEVPENPMRVVALAPSITEIIYNIGCGNKLVGATIFSDHPKEAERLPKVGSYIRLNLEKIISLKPDLCIAVKDGNPQEVARRLESMKIPVYAVHSRNLQDVMDTILAIGQLLRSEDTARTRVAEMESRINRVTRRIQKTDHRPRVFFQIGISPIVSVGTGTFIHGLIKMAGGHNLAAGPTFYPRFSKEQVVALGPDIFIITSMNREGAFDRAKNEWSRWDQMPAVRDGKIYMVDSNIFDRPSPRLVEALEQLAEIIHPDLFKVNP